MAARNRALTRSGSVAMCGPPREGVSLHSVIGPRGVSIGREELRGTAEDGEKSRSCYRKADDNFDITLVTALLCSRVSSSRSSKSDSFSLSLES